MSKNKLLNLAGLSANLYCIFANNTYYSEKIFPHGWRMFKTCPEHLQNYGYYGESYISVDTQNKKVTLVFAHRGTANSEGALVDIGLLFDLIPLQYNYGAAPFTASTLVELNDQYPLTEYTWDVHVTGHSLGGTLSEILIAGYETQGMKGMVFESPGSVPLIEKLINEGSLPPSALAYAKASTTCIYTAMDAVNTVMPTVAGTVGQIHIPNTYPGVFPNPYPAVIPNPNDYIFAWSRHEHSIAEMLKHFNNSGFIMDVTEWPEGFWAGYKAYVTYPEGDNLTQPQRYHQEYWDGYMNYLWNNCGYLSDTLQIAFFENFPRFCQFFKSHLLYQQQSIEEYLHPTGALIAPPIPLQVIRTGEEVWNQAIQTSHEIPRKFAHFEEFNSWYKTINMGLDSLPIHPSTITPSAPSLPPPSYQQAIKPCEFSTVNSTFIAQQDVEEVSNIEPSFKHENLGRIYSQIVHIQTKFKDVEQHSQRKNAIETLRNQCLAAEKSGSYEVVDNFSKQIIEIRNEIQNHHNAKYAKLGVLGNFFKLFTSSRTVKELDHLLETECDINTQQLN